METDLHQVISSNQPLSLRHCHYFMFQLLNGVKCLHDANVVHRDLKPSNILVNQDCTLKICDFGMGRSDDDAIMTEYVATRWYRAPEVFFTRSRYTKSIDIWSIGCIYSELLRREPLCPGVDQVDQIQKLLSILGPVQSLDTSWITDDGARGYLQSLEYNVRNLDELHNNNIPPECMNQCWF